MTEHPSPAAPAGPSYPGERLGLPARGSGSVASWWRRILALLIDWFASMLAAAVLFGGQVWGQGPEQWAPMGVFLIESTVLTPLLGGSFGQLVTRLAVVRLDGKPLGLLQALLRTLLICLVIPPLVFNSDQRGLHDLAVKSVVLVR